MYYVLLPMISKMILSSESFSTDIATIWTFIRMGSFMDEEIVAFGELSTAKFANKLFFGSRTSCTTTGSMMAKDGSTGVE